jgi:hypothetical protein
VDAMLRLSPREEIASPKRRNGGASGIVKHSPGLASWTIFLCVSRSRRFRAPSGRFRAMRAGSGACGVGLNRPAPREALANGCLVETRARRRPARVEENERRVTRPSGNTTGPPLEGLSGRRWRKPNHAPEDAGRRGQKAPHIGAGRPALKKLGSAARRPCPSGSQRARRPSATRMTRATFPDARSAIRDLEPCARLLDPGSHSASLHASGDVGASRRDAPTFRSIFRTESSILPDDFSGTRATWASRAATKPKPWMPARR